MTQPAIELASVHAATIDAERRALALIYINAAVDVALAICPSATDVHILQAAAHAWRPGRAECPHDNHLTGFERTASALRTIDLNPEWDLMWHGVDFTTSTARIAIYRHTLALADPALEHRLMMLDRAEVTCYEGLVIPHYLADGNRYVEKRYLPTLIRYAARFGFTSEPVRDDALLLHHERSCALALWECDAEQRWSLADFELLTGIDPSC